MSEYEVFVDLIPEDIKAKVPEKREHHAFWNLSEMIKKENPDLFDAAIRKADADRQEEMKKLIEHKWQEVMAWHVKEGFVSVSDHPEEIKREPVKTDKNANKRILALVKEKYMKRIPFFIRGHATQKTCELIAREFPDLYHQFLSEPDDTSVQKMSKLINGIFAERMAKHNM